MSTPDPAAVKVALLEATEKAGADRDAFLGALAAEAPDVHAEVLSLLDHEGADVGVASLGQRLAAALDDDPDHIGPYRILGRLGEGGMGRVYRAEQDHPRREVAIKRLTVGLGHDHARARFSWEVEALARLAHPHIAAVHDAGVHDGQPYLVMELVDGVEITDWCAANASDVDDVVTLFLTVCDAVQHAHQRGIVHRDLKPSNLLVATRDGMPWPMVIDFGIAKATTDAAEDGLTQLGQVVGTPAYMSPEQAGAYGGAVDTRTDVFALGVVLHELLTGSRPREVTATGLDALRAELTDTLPAAPSTRVHSALARRLRGDLDTIVLKALQPEPDRRYASVEAFADDLRRHQAGLPVRAHPDSWLYRTTRFVRRHTLGVALATIALTATLGATAVVMGQAATIRAERNRAVTAEADARADAATAERVTQLLAGLFDEADPSRSGGTDVTAREMLDRGAERVLDGLDEEPAVKARMLSTLTNVYLALGAYERAEDLGRQAMEQLDALDPGPTADKAWLLGVLSTTRHDVGDYEGAIGLAEQAVAMHDALGTRETTEAATLLNDLAVDLDALGRYDEAEARYREALTLQRATLGPDHPDTVWAINTLGQAVFRSGRWREGLTLFEEAVAGMRRAHGEAPHPDTAAALNNLGGALGRLDRRAEARTVLREALDQYEALYGDAHPGTGRAYANLATAVTATGDLDEGLRLLAEGQRILAATLPDRHPLRLGADLKAARIALRRGQVPRDLDALRSAFADAVGEGHLHVRRVDQLRGHAAWLAGDLDAAERLLVVATEGEADTPGAVERRLDLAAVRAAAGHDAAPVDTTPLAELDATHWMRRWADAVEGRRTGTPDVDAEAAITDRWGPAHPRLAR